MTTAPDRQALLPGLAADLRRLARDGGPQRTIALLGAYVTSIAVSGGDAARARVWWRRAQRAARASGDTRLAAYVAGQHIIQGMYGMHAPGQTRALADRALAITSAPCAGRMHALNAKARSLGLLGRTRDANAALAAMEVTFEWLPAEVTDERIASLGWAEERLHLARSFVAAFGDGNGGEAARREAMRLYVDADWRSRAQIELHGAAAETDPHHAVATLASLAPAQRNDRFVRQTAMRVLATCEDRRAAGAAELREALT